MYTFFSNIITFFVLGLKHLQAGLKHLSTKMVPTIQSSKTNTINESIHNISAALRSSTTIKNITSSFLPLNTIVVERMPAGSAIALRPIAQQTDDSFHLLNIDLLSLVLAAAILLLAITMVAFFFFRILAMMCTCAINLHNNTMRARAEQLEAAMALLQAELALKTKQSDEKLAEMQADHDQHQAQTAKAIASLQADLSTIKSHKAKLEETVEKLNSDNTGLWADKFVLRAELAEKEEAWESTTKQTKAELAKKEEALKHTKVELAEADGDVRAMIKMHRKTMALRETTIATLREEAEESAGAHLDEMAALRKNSLEVMKRQTSKMAEKHQAELAALRKQA